MKQIASLKKKWAVHIARKAIIDWRLLTKRHVGRPSNSGLAMQGIRAIPQGPPGFLIEKFEILGFLQMSHI